MISIKTKFGKLIAKLFVSSEEIDYINGADKLPPPLTKEEEQKAFELFATDEKKAKELLIVHNLRL